MSAPGAVTPPSRPGDDDRSVDPSEESLDRPPQHLDPPTEVPLADALDQHLEVPLPDDEP